MPITLSLQHHTSHPKLKQELIINLHGIGSPHDGVDSDELPFWVSQKSFVTLLETTVEARAITSFNISITFDDGNMSDAVVALPELHKRGLQAIFFVCASRIGVPHYLDRIALADLVAAGMEVGTHGMDHREWRRLDDTLLYTEIVEARRRIEDVCGKAVTKAAIPFGSYDRRVLMWLRRERLQCVYNSDGGLSQSQAWLKARNTMDNSWLAADIERVLTTNPSMIRRFRRNAKMLYKKLR